MFDSEFLSYLWIGSVLFSVMTLMAGALVPANRPRRLSDWLMIGGVGAFFFGVAFLVLILVAGNQWRYVDYELIQKLALAAAFTIPCGLLALSAGFLVSRFEIRRARLEAELRARSFPTPHPGHGRAG